MRVGGYLSGISSSMQGARCSKSGLTKSRKTRFKCSLSFSVLEYLQGNCMVCGIIFGQYPKNFFLLD